MMSRNAHHSDSGPAAIGPYSHGVWAGDLLFMSGQTPIDPGTGKLTEGGVAEQTEQVFRNIEAVLTDAGLSLHDVVKSTVFLTTMDDFADMNGVYATKFAEPYPARSTVAVAGLPMGARVEIEVVALRPGA
jgi:2-iminobutanoate/2-iminopropanoate deaminase